MTTRRFVYDRQLEKVVEVADECRPLSGLTIISDIAPYVSPCTDRTGRHPVITSRAHRREDLKRNHCVEVDPGHFKSLKRPN